MWKSINKMYHINRINGKKKKTHYNLYRYRKAFDKIQHTFNKLRMERYYLNITKAIYENPTVSILLKTEKLKAFCVR